MNIVEDQSIQNSEENRLNYSDDANEFGIDSNFVTNLNMGRSYRVLQNIKSLISFLSKNYAKIFGMVFLLIFLYGFTEIIQNHSKNSYVFIISIFNRSSSILHRKRGRLFRKVFR